MYRRDHWDVARARRWRCAVCKVGVKELQRLGARIPWNLSQLTCSSECARDRKTQLQRQARANNRTRRPPPGPPQRDEAGRFKKQRRRR